MSDIFNSRSGAVAVFTDQRVIPGRVSIEGFAPKAALIEGVDYGQETNQQFRTSLQRNIYLYTFGDQMGEITINGLAFPETCEDLPADGAFSSAGGGSENKGLLEVLRFYEENRLSIREERIAVDIATETILGYLAGLKIRSLTVADDPASFVSRYSLMIRALPKDPVEFEGQQTQASVGGDEIQQVQGSG